MNKRNGFVSILGLLIGLIVVAGASALFTIKEVNNSQNFGSTILQTQITDTIGTFRTNVNTSLTNLSNDLANATATIGTYGTIVTANSPLPVANGGTATTTAPANSSQFLGANGSVPTWKTLQPGTGINIATTTTSTIISSQGVDTTASFNWTGPHIFSAGVTSTGALVQNGTSTFGGVTTFNTTTTFNGTVIGVLNENNIYGTGVDGDVTISATTTLTEDKYYNNLTVNSGVSLLSANYKIFVRGTLTNNGSINVNGSSTTSNVGASSTPSGTLRGGGDGGNAGAANGGGGGAGGGFVLISARTIINNGIISANGGLGSSNVSDGSSGAGVAGVSIDSGFGGSGANGQTQGVNPGGTGGVVTASIQKIYIPSIAFLSGYNPILNKIAGGGGGGGGGGCGNPNHGGVGGGGGGGVVVIFYSIGTFGTETATGAGGAGNGTVLKIQL